MEQKLLALKQAQLKHLLFLSGCTSSSATKSILQRNLSRYLAEPLYDPQHARILSVDMGIRNLAYCVIEPKQPHDNHVKKRTSLHLQVKAWKKIDLLDRIKAGTPSNVLTEPDQKTDDGPKEKAADLFSPSTVSHIAYQLVNDFLAYRPSKILIERQRFRSNGGSAIQEWTLRVNMLESMLWACLTTIQRLQVKDILPSLAVHGVNPARVAKFWIGSQSGMITPTEEMLAVKAELPDVAVAKTTKQDRVNILQSWLQHPDESMVKLDFEDDAADIAASFQIKKVGVKAQKQKLDDLTDCLLQGAAWCQWEANRRRIVQLLSDKRSDNA